ncbi:hypothetical protein VKT23_005508 [Stygiomarasmius scandens]|uniref:Protein kinase domain-containing protein n=1 Tax=Marasmiellus scandens TaxID=2682957 RepID=A0ABR1JRV0_9AGAR
MAEIRIRNFRNHLPLTRPLPRTVDRITAFSWAPDPSRPLTFVPGYPHTHEYLLTPIKCLNNPETKSRTVFTAYWSRRNIPRHVELGLSPCQPFEDKSPGIVVVKFATEKQMNKLKTEAFFYERLRSTRCTPMYYGLYQGTVEGSGEVFACLVMEYVDGPKFTKEKKENEVLNHARLIHHKGVMHGDLIDQTNILRDREGNLRFIDFAQAWEHQCTPWMQPLCNELAHLAKPMFGLVQKGSYLYGKACVNWEIYLREEWEKQLPLEERERLHRERNKYSSPTPDSVEYYCRM